MNREEEETLRAAIETARFLADHKGEHTVLLDVSESSGWTDFFIITTVRSAGHMRGLVRELRSFLPEQGISLSYSRKGEIDEGWELIDCGGIIIHLMSEEYREFYDLEHLWYSGKQIAYSSS